MDNRILQRVLELEQEAVQLKLENTELKRINKALELDNKKLKDFIHKEKLLQSVQWMLPMDKTK